MKWRPLVISLTLLMASVFASSARAETAEVAFVVPPQVQPILNTYCTRCHGEKKQKGKVRLDQFGELSDGLRMDLLHRVREQLHLEEMPPEEEDKQPSAGDRKVLADWIRGEQLKRHLAPLEDEMRYPDRANWVNHQKLFSGEIKDKAASPARRWLVSPQIFQERVFDLFKLLPKERDFFSRGIFGLANPFTLPDRSGVRYYDMAALDGGNLFVMLNNAEWISGKQLRAARVKNGEFKADQFENKMDRWYPKVTPAVFEKIVLQKTPPSDEDLVAAIQAQFDSALQRPATDPEVKKYLDLTRRAIKLAGNSEGLRQMLSGVLLESEFVYRLEFGAGAPDQYGRKMLSPREASYAISYALGDRNPDAGLVAAARSGRLNTRADYEREVKRLLADETYYKGAVDVSLTSKNLHPHVSSHPRNVGFFRDFFGYPRSIKVFKDINRSNGFYENPDRGSSGTAGILTDEADTLVDYYLKQDQKVFENLLGTEVFYVAPVENAAAKMDMLNEVYERFKATDWKVDPKLKRNDPKITADSKLTPEDVEFIRKRLQYNAGPVQLNTAMTHITKFRDKGLNPHPVWDYAFGSKLTLWTASYNIDSFNWEYPREQPFKLPNRRGILTHPAWLIAFSQNTATDPVRRGKWVREKLLAGNVPDVPITVDAKIPEDPAKTLRERLDMVSTKEECWKCHQHMNPLGLAFECYDDFGRYRTSEILEHPDNLIAKTKTKYGADTFKTALLNSTGKLSGTEDIKLDGDVKDAVDLIGRLAKSERVRQSIIRHAFRFYMGRNEVLSDSQTLIDADKAYVSSGGSFKAVIVSLLTSDSFIFRK